MPSTGVPGASHSDSWFLPCSIPWVARLPEVAYSMTEGLETGDSAGDTGQPRFEGNGSCRALALATATSVGPLNLSA